MMRGPVQHNRRDFLERAAMAVAATHLGAFNATAIPGAGPPGLEAIGRATTWINSASLTAASLANRIVLVDFWTYTCINWLRTLPYIRAWAQKYSRGLVVIGVHTPEFGFEQNPDNVRRAVRQMKIEYPIVADNDYAIWRAFENNYWPAVYLLDGRGRVRYQHFGEGDYDRSEQAIQRLFADARIAADAGLVRVDGQGLEAPADWNNLRSAENYLGYGRTEHFASAGGTARDRRREYTVPADLAVNQWALAGEWTIGKQVAALTGATGRIASRFHARDVHLVMGPSRPGLSPRFRVTLDGKPPGSSHGGDADGDGHGTVVEQRLYQLIRQSGPIGDRRFEIEFLDGGVEAFAFTFG
jgi:thiol-disulfide isomerase/thioredoxin